MSVRRGSTRKAPASPGHKAAVAVLATIPPALVAAGVILAVHYWPVPSGAPPAESAELITEPANVPGSLAFNGTVAWRATEGDHGASIVADVLIPVEGTHVVLTFSKNTDQTMPASHLIEVAVSALPGSRAGPVAKIGNLTARSSPADAGTPLAATVVDVTDTLFWIALSPLSVDSAANLRLLGGASSFALPVTYASGASASVTFDKGPSGDAVVHKVLTAWGL